MLEGDQLLKHWSTGQVMLLFEVGIVTEWTNTDSEYGNRRADYGSRSITGDVHHLDADSIRALAGGNGRRRRSKRGRAEEERYEVSISS